MNNGFPTVIALVVCTALGVLAGFLAARLRAGKESGREIRGDSPTPPSAGSTADGHTEPEAESATMTATATIATPATPAVASTSAVTAAATDPTDAEIDALPPELPVERRSPRRGAPPRSRRFDTL